MSKIENDFSTMKTSLRSCHQVSTLAPSSCFCHQFHASTLLCFNIRSMLVLKKMPTKIKTYTVTNSPDCQVFSPPVLPALALVMSGSFFTQHNTPHKIRQICMPFKKYFAHGVKLYSVTSLQIISNSQHLLCLPSQYLHRI